ncbi:MAG: hypothetical protein IPM54_11425 [Polyangiaceae bacterium]|nr:hypothetical protein [Polyangiaceae bacterium]
MPTARRRLESKDIPQADSLENVRRIVDAVVDGLRTKAEVSERTGINPRHVLYGLHTARVLGFVNEDEGGGFSATELGKALHALTPNGTEEWERFRTAIQESEIIGAIAPQLLSSKPPAQDAITQKIVKATGLSDSTAGRRAQTLISWRTQLLNTPGQAPAPAAPAAPAAAEPAPAAPEADAAPVADEAPAAG